MSLHALRTLLCTCRRLYVLAHHLQVCFGSVNVKYTASTCVLHVLPLVSYTVLPSEELLNLFGGDMLLTAQQRALIERTSREEFGVTEEGLAAAPERDARAVVVETVAKWPNAVFFYDFAGNLGESHWRKLTVCLHFSFFSLICFQDKMQDEQ